VPVSILVNTALPRRASKEALKRETIMPWFNDFHGSGVNPGSWVFLQSRYFFMSSLLKVTGLLLCMVQGHQETGNGN
jgi:hypothetical protein